MNIWDPLTMYMYIECSSTVTCQNVWSLIRVLDQEPRRSFHVNAYKMYGPRTFCTRKKCTGPSRPSASLLRRADLTLEVRVQITKALPQHPREEKIPGGDLAQSTV